MKIDKQRLRTILTIGTCAGIGVTAYIGAKEGSKADPEIPVWENYKFTIIAAALTEACAIGSHKTGTKQIAAIGGALASMKTLYHQTERKVREKIGDEKFEEIKKEVVGDRAKMKMNKLRKDEDSVLYDKHTEGKELFYEPATDQFFYSTKVRIYKAAYKINKDFIHDPEELYADDGHGVDVDNCLGMPINPWLKAIGAEECPYGQEEFGWFWGDGNGMWDYDWSFFGGPWISVELREVTAEESDISEPYYIIDYGPMPPTWAFPDKAFNKEFEDAKIRWQNEYA